MRGSIRTKVAGKVYELRVALGKDPVTGRYRQKSVTVRGSRAEAQRALRRLLEEVEDGQHRALEGGSRTFGELLDEWLTHKAAADRSPTTVARYRSVIEWQLKPTLGAVALDRLETKLFDDLYRSLAVELEPASIRKAHVVARAALDRAVRWGWIRSNPATTAEPPPVRVRHVRPPDPEDVRRLILAAERDDPLFAVVLRVAAATGARRGELCALRWSDVDLNGSRLTIERSVIVVDGGVREAPTKTHNRRLIALDPGTLACLRQHLDQQRDIAARCETTLASDAFVFSRRPGGTHPLRPDNCTSSFERLRRTTGLSGFSLKDATVTWPPPGSSPPASTFAPSPGGSATHEPARPSTSTRTGFQAGTARRPTCWVSCSTPPRRPRREAQARAVPVGHEPEPSGGGRTGPP